MSSNKKETKKAKAPQGQIGIAMNNPKQLVSQAFVDISCASRAEYEGHADWSHFIDRGNEAAEVIKTAIATGDEELTSLACYLNDALMGITYFHNAQEALLPIWVETMPKDMLGNLVALSTKDHLERR